MARRNPHMRLEFLGANNPYVIGNPTAPADKRVDFAGVCVAGLMMSENAYNEAASLFSKER